MNFSKTLTRQFVVISIILLLFLGINTYSDFIFTHRMKGKAAGIDLASQLKSKTFEMAWIAERLAEKEIVGIDARELQDLQKDLTNAIAHYDRMLIHLKAGDAALEIKPLSNPDLLQLIETISENWRGAMKPVLVKITALEVNTPERQRRELVHQYGERLYSSGGNVDRLVSLLLLAYEEDIRKFDVFGLCVLGIFCVAAIIMIMYIRQNIAKPVKRFVQAAQEIEKGNFDVRIEVTNRDEIGELGQAFNRMADELATAFGQIMWHSEDVMSLNRALNKFVGLQKEDDLYQTICDHGRELFGLRTAWLGLLNDDDRNIRIVARSGFDDGLLSRATITWDDSVYGMGPVGTAIKTNLPQIINELELADQSLPGIREALSQGYRSCMAHPLICANCAVIGVMVFYSEQKEHFTSNMAELCQIFVNHAASVIENVILLKDLEARVQERTEKLQDALLLAEGANMAKSSFLSNMSHDLRTPLNAIIGFSEAMSQGIYGEIRADHKEYLEFIYQSGMKLLKLINEVLDLSKMETGSLELEYVECNISEMLKNALYIFREKAVKHRIQITLDVAEDAGKLTADATKIKQVVVNLITDSINATPDGGTILIEASRLSSGCTVCSGILESTAIANQKRMIERDCIQVAITDSRLAMTAEVRSRFFDPYKQFDTTLERKQDNVGLLLSKRYVELHGGRIWAEGLTAEPSADGSIHGNKFIFVLPERP